MVTFEPANIPDELRERDQWLLWDNSHDTPRRPHWNGDFSISWSDPDAWHAFDEAVEKASSIESWGIGYVMALDNDDHARGLYGCLDLDGCLTEDRSAKEWLPSLERFIEDGAYIEASPSGDGLHIPLVGQQAPDWWTDSHFSADEHEGVEYLTHKFVTFTGDLLHGDELAPDGVAETNPAPFLFEAYKTLNGESPRMDDTGGEGDGEHDDREWTKADVEELLSHVDSGCSYPQWRNIAFAVHDWDDGATGKSLFEDWSRGAGWDNESQRLIDAIWSNSEQGGSSNVTLGTLVHHAKQNGWSPSRGGGGGSRGGGDEPSGGDAPARGGDENGADGGAQADEADGWRYVRQQYERASTQDSPVEKNDARFAAAEQLLNEFHFANREDDDTLFVYDPETGVYDENGESVIRQRAREGLQGAFARQEVGELAEHIRAAATYTTEEFGGPDWHVAVENGVLELSPSGDVTRHDHAPEHRFIAKVGTAYDPDAECPRWRRYIDETVKSDRHRLKLQEFAGYCLMHWGLPEHKALFLVGPQASGKSTFADTLRELLGGAENVASMSPQQMTSRFGTAELFGAWANIRNDIPPDTIEETGTFKEIIAGDPIKAERKGRPLFHFRPTAKHVFSANQLPDAESDDGAFYRRILLVPFPTTIPRDERDKQLDEKLRDELPGILNWALDGLARLLDQDGFTGDLSVHETAETWDKWGSTVDRFAKACIETSVDTRPVPKGEAYTIYQRFCDSENFPAETQRQFTRRLKTEHGVEDGKARVDGRQERCFLNLALTGRGEQYQEMDSDDTDGRGLDGF